MKRFAVFVALALALTADRGWADKVSPAPFEYPYEVLVFDLPRSANGVDYRLYVRPPLRAPAAGEQAATIYFLDALANFVPAAAMTANYEHFNYLPAAYFIGIGYQDESDGDAKAHNRTRDYTPTAFKPADEQHFLANDPDSYRGSGGADAFLDVVQKEIIPFIEARYIVDQKERVLVGSSLGGLAAVQSVLTRPGLFQRYVILSPSIWWDDWFDSREQRVIMRTVAATRATPYPSRTRVYFAVGDAEEQFGLVTDVHVLADALRQRRSDNLRINLEVLPDTIHEGVFPTGFMRGILAIYSDDPRRRPSASRLEW